ncbi:hypothetical protein PILCRDRAFT_404241 [Piloderma croceum F 1598]|uniref:Uncharacterized protein n=1 Tax=Piloderma croceum (strain F 1598) TaxID=765440 RepID=A0A0C3BD50_PILCF|nr:hypothetical protein PILCRDRAFT_404241 [Piloderma croceum F 1598]
MCDVNNNSVCYRVPHSSFAESLIVQIQQTYAVQLFNCHTWPGFFFFDPSALSVVCLPPLFPGSLARQTSGLSGSTIHNTIALLALIDQFGETSNLNCIWKDSFPLLPAYLKIGEVQHF